MLSEGRLDRNSTWPSRRAVRPRKRAPVCEETSFPGPKDSQLVPVYTGGTGSWRLSSSATPSSGTAIERVGRKAFSENNPASMSARRALPLTVNCLNRIIMPFRFGPSSPHGTYAKSAAGNAWVQKRGTVTNPFQ
jgi:hypothetical protein